MRSNAPLILDSLIQSDYKVFKDAESKIEFVESEKVGDAFDFLLYQTIDEEEEAKLMLVKLVDIIQKRYSDQRTEKSDSLIQQIDQKMEKIKEKINQLTFEKLKKDNGVEEFVKAVEPLEKEYTFLLENRAANYN